MSDTTQAEASRSKAIAKREWINAAGEKVPAGDPAAVGFRYTYLANGEGVDYLIGEAGKLATMFGIMGGLTKVGNIVNSVVNADDYNGSDNPMEAVREWLAEADAGVWREPGEAGSRGPKYDKDVLAAALLAVLAGKAKGDVAAYRERLEERSYYAKVRGNPEVMARYMQEMAERGKATGGNTDALA